MSKKLQLFEDKIGIKWATWLAENREARLEDSPVLGHDENLSEARWAFLKALEVAAKDGTISIFNGDIKLIE